MSTLQSDSGQSWFKRIFYSPVQPRLRAGWRLLFQIVLMLFIGICLIVPVALYLIFSGNINFDLNNISSKFLLVNEVYEFVMFTASIYLARRFLDKRPFSSLGLTLNITALQDVLAGIVVTFVMMGLIFVLEVSTGWLKFENFAWQVEPIGQIVKGVVPFLMIFTFTAWNEELLSRGYHLQTITSGLNRFWGIVLSSAIFGILHLGNPNATWVSTAGIFMAGLFFAFGYLRTNQLWFPMGMHFGWNFFEGVVFGFPVSGLDIYRLARIQIQGPEIWTGGAFGPEAGLVMLPALIFGSLLIYFYTRNRIPTS